MKDFLKKTGWTNIITSIIFAIIGVFLIVQTNSATKIIAYILGGIFIIVGCVKMISYFMSKGSYDFYNYELIYGIIAVIIGIITIYYSSAIEFMFRIMIGVWIIYSGALRLSLSMKLKTIKSNLWQFSLIMAIIILLCGIYMTFTQGALIVTIGVIMVVYSIMDLIESFIFVKNVDALL